MRFGSRMVLIGSVAVLAGCGSGVESEVTVAAAVPAAALEPATPPAAEAEAGLVRRLVPAEDPGPPLYLRATPINNELFVADGWLAIPFYRDPSCVPAGFNVLQLFDFPGPDRAGAFACSMVLGGSLLTEADARQGTFPRQAVLTGTAVPIWFVRWEHFKAAAADDTVTFAELRALQPRVGTADRFHEALMPRPGSHRIVIDATGRLEDGTEFEFGVVHVEDETRSIRIRFH